mgnify:CR=1 FL=1
MPRLRFAHIAKTSKRGTPNSAGDASRRDERDDNRIETSARYGAPWLARTQMKVGIPEQRIQRQRLGTRSRDVLTFALFVAPNFLAIGLFSYWPLVRNVWLSFTYWDMIAPEPLWIGISNWLDVFTSATFLTVSKNTLTFTVFSVGSTLLLALGAALLLHQPLRLRNVVRASLFAPAILPGSAVALVWTFLYAPNFGLVSQAAVAAGLPKVRYLNDPVWAMPAILLVVIWRRVGYDAVIFLAGLQGISRELYEAARVDGANAFQRFRHVTVPGLSPVAFFLLVTSILASFQSFDVIRVMTSGGPVIATTTLIYQVFQEAFVAFNAGRAAVYATILFALMLSVTLLQMRLLERRVTYE